MKILINSPVRLHSTTPRYTHVVKILKHYCYTQIRSVAHPEKYNKNTERKIKTKKKIKTKMIIKKLKSRPNLLRVVNIFFLTLSFNFDCLYKCLIIVYVSLH